MGVNRPGALSFPFPFHHPKGAGVSTLREGKKAGADRTTIQFARDTAPAGLRRSAVPRERSYLVIRSFLTPSLSNRTVKRSAVVAIGVDRRSDGSDNGAR
jgi:hypothetical protein